MIFIIVCISWSNKKCFDTIDARCEHEDETEDFSYDTSEGNYN